MSDRPIHFGKRSGAGFDLRQLLEQWTQQRAPKTPGDMFVEFAQAYRELERRVESLEAQLKELQG
jgi:hypothetical protein